MSKFKEGDKVHLVYEVCSADIDDWHLVEPVEKLKKLLSQAVDILVHLQGSSYCDIPDGMRLDIDQLEDYVRRMNNG